MTRVSTPFHADSCGRRLRVGGGARWQPRGAAIDARPLVRRHHADNADAKSEWRRIPAAVTARSQAPFGIYWRPAAAGTRLNRAVPHTTRRGWGAEEHPVAGWRHNSVAGRLSWGGRPS